MFAVIQTVYTEWDKEARGGPAAGERNAVPEALPLPETPPLADGDALTHTAGHSFNSRRMRYRGPKQGVAVLPLGQGLWHDNLRITADAGALHVDVVWRRGAPDRPRRRDALILQPGQWGSVRYNLRDSNDDGWWYEKWVVNVAFCTAYGPDLFVSAPPVVVFTQMARLW